MSASRTARSDGAAEVAVAVGEAGGGDADRIGAGPGLGVEQDPFADRLAGEAQVRSPLMKVHLRKSRIADVPLQKSAVMAARISGDIVMPSTIGRAA